MVPCFDTAQEAWEGLDGGLGKGWGADWETEPHTPSLCYFFLNEDFFFQPHIGCAVKNPSDIEFSHSDHFCYLDQHVHHVTYLKDVQISAHTSAPLPTLVSIATASITLHHAVCPWVWPTQQPQPQHYLKDPAHSSSKPLWDQIWLLLSGGFLIQLLHLTGLLGRDGSRQAQEYVNVTLWQGSRGNVRMFFDAELILGRALFKCPA